MQQVAQKVIVISTKTICPSDIFRAVLVNVVVFEMAANHHGGRDGSRRTDEKIRYPIQQITSPYAKVNLIVMNHLHPNTKEQQRDVLPPHKAIAPLQYDQPDVGHHVSKRL